MSSGFSRATASIRGVPCLLTGERRNYSWAELLRRVFRVDVLTCPCCGGVRRLRAAIQGLTSIERVASSPFTLLHVRRERIDRTEA